MKYDSFSTPTESRSAYLSFCKVPGGRVLVNIWFGPALKKFKASVGGGGGTGRDKRTVQDSV